MGIQSLIIKILFFINDIIVPFIMGLAFLFFVWNAYRFFILQGASPDGREKARRLMLWGIIAFVLIVSFWAIINAFVAGFDVNRSWTVCPDYTPDCNSQTSPNQSSGFFNNLFGGNPATEEDLEPFGGAGPDVRDDRDPLGDDMKNK